VLKKRAWLGVAIVLFSSAASAQTYPITGVWIAKDDRFPGSTGVPCLLLKELRVDAVLAQSFPRVMFFSEDKRLDIVEGDLRAERTIRSVKSATDGQLSNHRIAEQALVTS
jgi:hypothetical protein